MVEGMLYYGKEPTECLSSVRRDHVKLFTRCNANVRLIQSLKLSESASETERRRRVTGAADSPVLQVALLWGFGGGDVLRWYENLMVLN